MIARLWHGVTNTENADEYLEYLNKTGIPDYKATPGSKARPTRNCGDGSTPGRVDNRS